MLSRHGKLPFKQYDDTLMCADDCSRNFDFGLYVLEETVRFHRSTQQSDGARGETSRLHRSPEFAGVSDGALHSRRFRKVEFSGTHRGVGVRRAV